MDPSIGISSAKDIDDTISCIEFFNKIKEFSKNEEIFNYIKEEFKGNEKLIESFKNFSYVYGSIIDLNHNFDDFNLNLYDEVKK